MKTYHERAEHAWDADSLRLVLTPSEFARSSLFYIQELGHFRALPAYFTERENLDSYLIVYTKAGQGQLTYKDELYILRPGQLFFIDCMEYQYYRTASSEPWELLWVHVNGASLRGYYEQFAGSGDPLRNLGPSTRVPAILAELLELQTFKSFRGELIASKLLVELLTELLLSGPEADSPDAQKPQYITGAQSLIQKRYPEKLTLDLLARMFAVNKYHLAKEFKRHTGFSPGEYIINTRITRAKELLTYSQYSIAEIAEAVGIENVSHFINLFKERVECTPLVYRKKWQSKQ